ncbi:MAG: hypothetical protein R3346_02930 [Candidatus Spechtbacterales bacterium]|nr:hypothetical protein [Candidatus Spechtbacterales bacterium]
MKKKIKKKEAWKAGVDKGFIEVLPRSVKEHVRIEKARIRRTFDDADQKREMIEKLYEDFAYFQKDKKADKADNKATKSKK